MRLRRWARALALAVAILLGGAPAAAQYAQPWVGGGVRVAPASSALSAPTALSVAAIGLTVADMDR